MQDSEVGTEQTSNYQWYVVTTLMVGYLFAFLDRTIIGLMVEPIQSDLQISDTQMSLLMGIAVRRQNIWRRLSFDRLEDRSRLLVTV